MRLVVGILAMVGLVQLGAPAHGQDATLERLLRAQVFNTLFEGFDFYHLRIDRDELQSDGSREVLVEASGRFLERTQRMKVLLLVVGEQVVGGQILEGTGLPACLPAESNGSASL